MTYTFIFRACSDLPVVVCCRVMKVSTSGFYAWRAQPCSDRDYDDAVLTNTIVDIHRMSRRSYGSPRVHAALRLGEGIRCSRKRVERLMAQAGVAGIYRRRGQGCTRRDGTAPADDLVNRSFDPIAADRLWVMDVTEHPTGEGKVYLAVVLDAFSRRVVGWSIADHIRSELVVEAVQMAVWRRQPPAGQTVGHSDHGSTYTSWAFGRRLRGAGLLGSMGSIGDCFDNSVAAVSGSFLLSQALADTSSPIKPSPAASTTQPSSGDVSIRAATLAGLAQMCLDGQHNAYAHARYEATAAANPTVAQQIGADCNPVIVKP